MSDEFAWARRDGCVGLTQAVKALTRCEARRPDERDVPPPSTFPMTRAAKAALEQSGASKDRQRRARYRAVNRGGEIVREPPPENVVPISVARKRR